MPKPELLAIPHLYRPRIYQIPLYNCLADGFRRGAIVWHRRSGKDLTCWAIVIKEAMKRRGVYYYFFPTYNLGRKVLWDGIGSDGLSYLDHLPPGTKKNSQEMKAILPNGSLIQVVGTDNFDSIVGPNPIGCVFSEFSLQDPRAWEFIRPILAENKGWAIFNFTPRGKNHGWDLWNRALKSDRWFTSYQTVNDTKRPDGKRVITQKDIQDEIEDGMSTDMVQQEFFCSFDLGVEGAYFVHQMALCEREHRIVERLFDARYPVKTAWDLGVGDSCVIWWFQEIQKEIHVINYYEDSGKSIPFYASILDEKQKNFGYRYSHHFAPHDVEHREKYSARSVKDQAKDISLEFVTVPRDYNVQAGIEVVRGLLPKCWFDEQNTLQGRRGLENYRKEYNAKLKCYSDRPLHDWASHPADAFRILANAVKLQKTGTSDMTAEEVRSLERQHAHQPY